MRDLHGKVAVVTGGGSGIGKATAVALAGQGVIVCVADLDPLTAKRTAEMITAAGGRAAAYVVDITAEDQMRELSESTVRDHGAVDIVVNCAGIFALFHRMVETPLELHRKIWEVNYLGVLHGSYFFLPHLLTRPRANLVNVASYAGILGVPGITPYVASKFAVRGLTEAIRMEVGAKPVTVTLVYPGATKTAIMANATGGDDVQRAKLQGSLDSSKATSPETAARLIVNGIRKDKPRVLTGTDTKLLDTVVRVAPGAYARFLRKPLQRNLQGILG